MTDTTNTANATATESKAPKPKTVADDMKPRRVLESTGDAKNYLETLANELSDWGDGKFAFAAPGIDDEGNFDSAVYTDDMDVLVAKLVNKGAVKAVVVAPIPKIDVILADEAGKAWATKILHKELNHVAVRALREADDVSTVVDQIPTTLAGYIESGRAGAGIMETFNELYKQINATLSKAFPVWGKYRLIKTELKKAMESTAYATEIYAALEGYTAKGIDDGLFVAAIKIGIAAAKRKGLDPAIFERWLATRDQKAYDPAQPDEGDEEEAFDIDSLTDSLLAEPETEEAAPTDDASA